MSPCTYGTRLSRLEADRRFRREQKRGIYTTGDGCVSFVLANVGYGKYVNELSDDGNTLLYCASRSPSDLQAMAHMRDQQLPVRVLLIVNLSEEYDWGCGLITKENDVKVERGRVMTRYRIVRMETTPTTPSGAPDPKRQRIAPAPTAPVPAPVLTAPVVTAPVPAPVVTAPVVPAPVVPAPVVPATVVPARVVPARVVPAPVVPRMIAPGLRAPAPGPLRSASHLHCPQSIGTLYAGCAFKSLLEAKHAFFFDALGLAWEYESYTIHGIGPRAVSYTIDFWLPEIATYVEIKPRAPYDPQRLRCEELCRRMRQDVVLLYNTSFTVPFAQNEDPGLAYSHANGIQGMRWRYDHARCEVAFDEGVVWMQEDGARPRFEVRRSTADRRCFAPALLDAYHGATVAGPSVMCSIDKGDRDV